MKIILTLLLYINSAYSLNIESLGLTGKYKSFCESKDIRELKSHKVIFYKKTKERECKSNTGEIIPIASFVQNLKSFYLEDSRITLRKACRGSNRRKWKSNEFITEGLSYNLPNNPCICSVINNFSETKKAICGQNEEGTLALESLFETTKIQMLATNTIKIEREANYILDEMKKNGHDSFCKTTKVSNCSGTEDLYKKLFDQMRESEDRYEFTKKVDFNLEKFSNNLNSRKGIFSRPTLQIGNNLANYLSTNIEGSNKIVKTTSTTDLNKLRGKGEVHHIREMQTLRKKISSAGSLEKLIKNKLGDKSASALATFCKFNPEDPKELNDLKVTIFTHQDIAFKTCADTDGVKIVKNGSKALLQIMNASAKSVDKTYDFAESIKDELKKEFLEDMPRRCKNLKKRMDLVCKMGSVSFHELIEMSKIPSIVGNLDIINEIYSELGIEALKALGSLRAVACFTEKSFIPKVSGHKESKYPEDIITRPSSKEVDRSVDEEKVKYEKRLSDIMFAEDIRKVVKKAMDKDPGIVNDPEFQNTAKNYKELLPEYLREKIDFTASAPVFRSQINFLKNQAKKDHHESLGKIQNSLVRRYANLASKQNGRKRYAKRLSKIKSDIQEVTRITGSEPSRSFSDRYFAGDTNTSTNQIKVSTPAPLPQISQSADGEREDDLDSEFTSAYAPYDGSELENKSNTKSEATSKASVKKGSHAIIENTSGIKLSGGSSLRGDRNSRSTASIENLSISLVANENERAKEEIIVSKKLKDGEAWISYNREKSLFEKWNKSNGKLEREWPLEKEAFENQSYNKEDISITKTEKEDMQLFLNNLRARHGDLLDTFKKNIN
ncbi:hypothetical protein A9Q84_05915 [Halobacteriovorax marinus]|uniref:Uncharacterized protein n=1 Tax=Halobacteriovorax marinus TaxID=97084 RepID=A0A1Y5FBL8_9BACT|nr:hypothetical protein A9Q84_05915 [Halobacteriovorax marinus]